MIFSRNLNYQDVFESLIANLKKYSEEKISDINNLNKIGDEINREESIIKNILYAKNQEIVKDTVCILGVSGGMDSTIVNLIASLIFGAKNIYTFSLPTIHNSAQTKEAAEVLPKLLNNHFTQINIPIEKDDKENGQAWKRALILQKQRDILIGERKNSLVLILNTSNLSEINLGNFTINGDTIGEVGCLRNLYKSEIYQLIEWMIASDGRHYLSNRFDSIDNWNDILNCINEVAKIIPSAELKANQSDADVLLNYDYYYHIADMIMIAKDLNCDDEEIINQIVKESEFRNWAKNFDQSIKLKDLVKYAMSKTNYRMALGDYKSRDVYSIDIENKP